MAKIPYYCEAVPEVEIRGAMGFVHYGPKRPTCMDIPTLRRFYTRLGAAIAVHDHPPENVVLLERQG